MIEDIDLYSEDSLEDLINGTTDPYQEVQYIVLVIYDIVANKQRYKVAKLLDKYGIRVQKSCFEAKLNRKQYNKLISELKATLKADDNVRVYKIHGNEEITTFGSKKYEDIEDVIIV
jgi:CRISPR-associated protein Cas2